MPRGERFATYPSTFRGNDRSIHLITDRDFNKIHPGYGEPGGGVNYEPDEKFIDAFRSA